MEQGRGVGAGGYEVEEKKSVLKGQRVRAAKKGERLERTEYRTRACTYI